MANLTFRVRPGRLKSLLQFRFRELLILVLGLSVFSILERAGNQAIRVADFINISLVFVTLIIDGVALSAILFRLTSYVHNLVQIGQ